jgi:hypothetical protein
MIILNLTQHPATQEQLAAGVVDLTGENLARLKELLTFDSLANCGNRNKRADQIAALVARVFLPGDPESLQLDGTAIHCMIGGAPYLMAPLEAALIYNMRVPVYAFSVRESVEETQPDATVRKVNVFRHAGFVS